MKASGDTACDLNASKSTSFVKKEDIFGDNFMMKGLNPETKLKETKSILPIITEKRYLQKRYSKNEYDDEIHCFTPNVVLSKNNRGHQLASKDVNKVFLGDDSSDEGADPEKINELFCTNNWKQNMKDLFSTESPMKSSFHEGK